MKKMNKVTKLMLYAGVMTVLATGYAYKKINKIVFLGDGKIEYDDADNSIGYRMTVEEQLSSACVLKTEKLFDYKVNEDVKTLILCSSEQECFTASLAEQISKIFPNMEKLVLLNKEMAYEPNSLEQLKKLRKIYINMGENCDIDFTKLTFLDTLYIASRRPYTIPISFNTNEYNTLIENSTNVVFINDEIENKYLEVSKKLDDIVLSLGITDDMTFSQKKDLVIEYVLRNLSYDKEVAKLNATEELYIELTKSFYLGGILYGALEKSSSICGNYAALTEALLDRVDSPEKSYYVRSRSHAWNIISDEDVTYLDTTWIDFSMEDKVEYEKIYDDNGVLVDYRFLTEEEMIDRKYYKYFHWYNVDIYHCDDDYTHNATYIPQYVLKWY